MWSARLFLFLSAQIVLPNLTEGEPLFQEVETPASTEGVVIRPVEGGIVIIGSASTSMPLPNLRFLPGQFPPSVPPDNSNLPGGGSVGHANDPPSPPREIPSPPPPPPVLPTTTIASGDIVEFGSGVIPTHVKNNGYAAIGSFRSIGDLSVQGDFAVEDGSYLHFDVGGTDPGEYDLIREYRQFAMSGTIRIIFKNGYAPHADEIVPLVHFPKSLSLAMYSLSPEKFQFANITRSPTIGIWVHDNIFGIRFYADTTFVPEPSTMFLVACGILISASQRRWR